MNILGLLGAIGLSVVTSTNMFMADGFNIVKEVENDYTLRFHVSSSNINNLGDGYNFYIFDESGVISTYTSDVFDDCLYDLFLNGNQGFGFYERVFINNGRYDVYRRYFVKGYQPLNKFGTELLYYRFTENQEFSGIADNPYDFSFYTIVDMGYEEYDFNHFNDSLYPHDSYSTIAIMGMSAWTYEDFPDFPYISIAPYVYYYTYNNVPTNYIDFSVIFVTASSLGVDSYRYGYNDGYKLGFDDGYAEGVTVGQDIGRENGYDEGFIDGLATQNPYTFGALFASIADTPILIVRSLFNFDFFGVNLLTVVLSLFTAFILFYLLRKLF